MSRTEVRKYGIIQGKQTTANRPLPPIRQPAKEAAVFLEVYPQVLVVSTLKRCSKCSEYKPRDQFRPHKLGKDRLHSQCKACGRESSRRYRAANIEKEREKDRCYRTENIEIVRERTRQWRANNPEKVRDGNLRYRTANVENRREGSRRWRAENPERAREKDRQWRKNNPDKAKTALDLRRARKHGNGGTYTPADLAAIRVAQTDSRGRLICWRCGKPINGTPHLDHWIPIDKAGENSAGNLHYMHAKCNLNKANKHPFEIGRLL